MKKYIIVLLTLLLSWQTVQAAFFDVPQNHPNRIAIEYLQQENIISGNPDGSFRPNSAINRAEKMKILVEGEGITPSVNDYNNCFPDVTTEWFAPYVCYAKAQDWVGGFPDGTFKPAQNVTNIESLKMTLNAKNITLDPDFNTQSFGQINPSEWFYPFVVTAEKLNLIGNLIPGENYTRAEVSEVIFRSLVVEGTNFSTYSTAARDEFLGIETIPTDEPEEPTLDPARYELYTPENRAIYEGDRPFALFFHASWCPICRTVESELKANLSNYPDGFLILQADYDTDIELRQEFGITTQTSFVIFNEKGEVTFSKVVTSADQVVQEFEKVL